MEKIAYFGIDGGLSGSLAVIIVSDKQEELAIYDFNDQDSLIRLQTISKTLRCFAVLENVVYIPYQSTQSQKYQNNVFQWKGRLEALNVPFDMVQVSTWRKAVFSFQPTLPPIPKKGTPKEKRQAIYQRKKIMKAHCVSQALAKYPHARAYLKLVKHHDRAEALLMARYCKIINTNETKVQFPM